MVKSFLLIALVVIVFLPGCKVIKDSPKYGFSEGYYSIRQLSKPDRKAYVVPTDDSIKVFSAKSLSKDTIDAREALKIAIPLDSRPPNFHAYRFKKNTLDLDILTILFKYRPEVNGFPRQLNASFNGAVYIGYRTDLYDLTYKETPLKTFKREIIHYGYSFGIFTGIGSARIDEYVTNYAINIQYDGVVNLTGISAIVAVNRVSLGMCVGVDFLLDRNSKFWVNHSKPWLGLSLGLNLN